MSGTQSGKNARSRVVRGAILAAGGLVFVFLSLGIAIFAPTFTESYTSAKRFVVNDKVIGSEVGQLRAIIPFGADKRSRNSGEVTADSIDFSFWIWGSKRRARVYVRTVRHGSMWIVIAGNLRRSDGSIVNLQIPSRRLPVTELRFWNRLHSISAYCIRAEFASMKRA